MDCCDRVIFINDFLTTSGERPWNTPVVGTFSKYEVQPTSVYNSKTRKNYKLDGSDDTCLHYSYGRWAVSACDEIGTWSQHMRSDYTSEICVSGVKHWIYKMIIDHTKMGTVEVKCIECKLK